MFFVLQAFFSVLFSHTFMFICSVYVVPVHSGYLVYVDADQRVFVLLWNDFGGVGYNSSCSGIMEWVLRVCRTPPYFQASWNGCVEYVRLCYLRDVVETPVLFCWIPVDWVLAICCGGSGLIPVVSTPVVLGDLWLKGLHVFPSRPPVLECRFESHSGLYVLFTSDL